MPVKFVFQNKKQVVSFIQCERCGVSMIVMRYSLGGKLDCNCRTMDQVYEDCKAFKAEHDAHGYTDGVAELWEDEPQDADLN